MAAKTQNLLTCVPPILYPSKQSGTCALSSECEIDKDDFRDWMPFLPSNAMEEINPNPEALSTNT